jgi:hypothetical protein
MQLDVVIGGFEYPDGRSQQHNKCCIDIAGMSWSMQFDVVIGLARYVQD